MEQDNEIIRDLLASKEKNLENFNLLVNHLNLLINEKENVDKNIIFFSYF